MRGTAIFNTWNKDEVGGTLQPKNQKRRNHCEDLGEMKIILKWI